LPRFNVIVKFEFADYRTMEIWLDLLNSDWHDYRGSGRREDRLDDAAWIERYTTRWKDKLGGVAPREIRTALKHLRKILRRAVNRIVAGKNVPGNLWADLNSLLAASPIVRRFEKAQTGYAIRLVPLGQDLNAVIAEIVISFCETLVNGELSRIKICNNRDCLWVFYDRSKNRSRRWCEGNTGCGNLMKVRRFRAKKKENRTRPQRAY